MTTETFFEISSDDIQNAVYDSYDKSISWDQAEDLMDTLDLNEASKSASYYDNLHDQTNAVVENIREQLNSNKEAQELLRTF